MGSGLKGSGPSKCFEIRPNFPLREHYIHTAHGSLNQFIQNFSINTNPFVQKLSSMKSVNHVKFGIVFFTDRDLCKIWNVQMAVDMFYMSGFNK